MAFSAFTAGRLFQSAVHMLARSDRTRGELSLTRQLQRANPHITGGNYQSFQAVARRALKAQAAAEKLSRRSVNPLGHTEHGIDHSIDPGQPQYRYRVIVTGTDSSGAKASVTVNVNSDTALTQAQVREAAMDLFDPYGAEATRAGAAVRSLGEVVALETRIIAAGRAP